MSLDVTYESVPHHPYPKPMININNGALYWFISDSEGVYLDKNGNQMPDMLGGTAGFIDYTFGPVVIELKEDGA